jgi:Ca2+-binding EF-hand superfamily protein
LLSEFTDLPAVSKPLVQIDEEEIGRIKEIFKALDLTTGGKGRVLIDDLGTLLRLLNYNLSQAEIEELQI